ncbi:hypothetical protein E4T43_04741 [Aureobasidium subglaciale]|nr:hypothetical protein E4T43_04741 [Aureobasidium subglaciale]
MLFVLLLTLHSIDNGPVSNPKTAEKVGLAEDIRVATSEARWVEVEGLPDYYANAKPPGRKVPTSRASDGMNQHIDGDADDIPFLPVEEAAEQPKKKSRSGVRKKKSRAGRKK